MIQTVSKVLPPDIFPCAEASFTSFAEAQEYQEELVLAELIYSCYTVYVSPDSALALAKHVLVGMKRVVARSRKDATPRTERGPE